MFEKILVTGADGFIGSHLVEILVKEGYRVRALVQYNSLNNLGWLEQVNNEIAGNYEIVSGNIVDTNFVDTLVAGCDKVLHLAALIAIPYSYLTPASYVETNITGTLNILQASLKHNVTHTISTSTSETYGTAQYVPITENHPLNAQSPYAASKIGADQVALSFHKSFDMPVSVIRPFNTYGPRQSARAVIPTIICQILGGAKSIKLGALTPTRDFTFVTDTAQGFVQAMNCKNCFGEVTNIGSNFEISIGETVELISNEIGFNVEVINDENRNRPSRSEVERLFACTKKAQKLFDWSPRYAGRKGFINGLKETIKWFKEPKNLSYYKIDQYNI